MPEMGKWLPKLLQGRWVEAVLAGACDLASPLDE